MTEKPGVHRSPRLTRREALVAGGAASLGVILAARTGSTAWASTFDAKGVGLDSKTKKKLNAVFDENFAKTGVAGAAGAMWIGSRSWKRVQGVRDLESKEPYDAKDFVRIASITKSYTGTAVLQLVDQKKLALSDKLETFVPGITNGDRITIEDMLGMRSGIFDYTSDDTVATEFTVNPLLPWSNAQTLAVIKAHEPAFEPGAKVVYADSNYALLGMIIEKVTGRPPGEIITKNIIDQLELPGTSYPKTPAMPNPHPTAYLPFIADPTIQAAFDNAAHPPRVTNEVNPDFPTTAGAMISTLADLRVWGEELGRGSLLSPKLQRLRVSKIQKLDGQKINFGYGLGVIGLNEFLGHDGAIVGYSTVVFHRPQTDTTVAIVCNESSYFTTPALNIAFELIATLYPDQVK